MSDQPALPQDNDPTAPPPNEPTRGPEPHPAGPPTPATPPAPEAAQPPPAPPIPPAQPGYGAVPPPPPEPPTTQGYGPPAGFGAPEPAAAYGAPAAYGASAGYGAQQPSQPRYDAPPPGYAEYGAAQQNPYGGYLAAPPAGDPAYPGTLAYVQQHFGQVANFGQRAAALLIDVAVELIAVVPLVIGIIITAVSAPETRDVNGSLTSVAGTGSAGGIAAGVILIVLSGLLAIGIGLWNRVFRMGRTGQSVGKRAIGLMLINDQTGRPIGAGMCFVRELVHSIVNQVIYLSYLWMLWDDNKQTLADKAVKSTVVVLPRA